MTARTALHRAARGEVIGRQAGALVLREVGKFYPGVWLAPVDEVLLDFAEVSFAAPAAAGGGCESTDV